MYVLDSLAKTGIQCALYTTEQSIVCRVCPEQSKFMYHLKQATCLDFSKVFTSLVAHNYRELIPVSIA